MTTTTLTKPTPKTSSLATRALLVSLNISAWTGNKRDA